MMNPEQRRWINALRRLLTTPPAGLAIRFSQDAHTWVRIIDVEAAQVADSNEGTSGFHHPVIGRDESAVVLASFAIQMDSDVGAP
jgi:hypothetical protein